MKKYALLFSSILLVVLFSSCNTTQSSYLPQVTSMVKAVTFNELNLTDKDYEILDRIEATAIVHVTISGNSFIVDDPDGQFHVEYTKDPQTGSMILKSFDGVIRAGYLTREYSSGDQNYPEDIARKLAIYRLINLVREQGGDGVIEPVIATNFDGMNTRGLIRSETKLTYIATVSGKLVRLKSSK